MFSVTLDIRFHLATVCRSNLAWRLKVDCTRFWVLKNHVTVMCLQVDVHAVGEALGSAVDVLNALQVSVSSLSPKVSPFSGPFGNLCA